MNNGSSDKPSASSYQPSNLPWPVQSTPLNTNDNSY
jgi:hypothetical protein